MNRKISYLLPAGMLWIAASMVISHYFALSDFTNGLLRGVGIGLLLLAVLVGVKGRVQRSTHGPQEKG